MTQYLIYLLVGRLFIYLAQKFGHLDESKIKFIKDLFSCDLCLGVWLYTFLSWGTGIQILSDVIQSHTLIMGLVTGGVSSFLVHLIVLGWREKFGVIIID